MTSKPTKVDFYTKKTDYETATEKWTSKPTKMKTAKTKVVKKAWILLNPDSKAPKKCNCHPSGKRNYIVYTHKFTDTYYPCVPCTISFTILPKKLK